MNYCDNGPCETEATKFYITDKGVIFYLCDTCAGAFELGQVNPDADLQLVSDLDIDDQIRDWIATSDGGTLDKEKPIVVTYGNNPDKDPDVFYVWLETSKDVAGPEWPGTFDGEEEADAFAQRVEGALLDLGYRMLTDWPPESPLKMIDWALLGNQTAELAKVMTDKRNKEGDTDAVQALEGLWNMCHALMDWKEKE